MGEQVVTYPAAFIAGLVSFISPCVLPVIPGYLSFISGVSAESMHDPGRRSEITRTVAWHSLFFILGFSTVFILLGWTASSLGQFLLSYLHIFNRIAGVLLVLFGLHVMGVLRIPFLNYEKRFQARSKPIGVWGAFLIGLAFAFGWTPCIGPILAGVLTMAAQADSQWQGVGLLSVYSAGLGIPFFLTALAFQRFLGFFRWMRNHMRAVEIVSGLFLVAVGVLVFTNSLTVIAARLLEWFPVLSRLG
jgi:cytochrome c-type biogenesis protein